MPLSPVDLAYLSRLGAPSELTYEQVRHLRELRAKAVRSGNDRSELRLLDDLLQDAERIETIHRAPDRARARLGDIEEQLTAQTTNGTASAVATRDIAEMQARNYLRDEERAALADVRDRYPLQFYPGTRTPVPRQPRTEEEGRVQAYFTEQRRTSGTGPDDGPPPFERVVRTFEEELAKDRNARRERQYRALIAERNALHRHLTYDDKPGMAWHIAALAAKHEQERAEAHEQLRQNAEVTRRGPEAGSDSDPVLSPDWPRVAGTTTVPGGDDGEVVYDNQEVVVR